MQELGLKIDVSGVEQAIEALDRLEAAAIAAQKSVGAVGYVQTEHKGEAVIPEKKEMLSIVRVEFDQEMQKTVVILSNGATLEGLVKVDASIDVNEGNVMCSIKALVYDCN